MSNIMVIAEDRDGALFPSTFELLGKGRELAGKVGGSLDCLILSDRATELAPAAFEHGADRVIVAAAPDLTEYRFQPFVRIAAELARKHAARLVLLPSSFRGKELAGGLAAALDWGLSTEVTEIDVAEGGITLTRACFGGNRLATITVAEPELVVAVRPKAFPAPAAESGRSGEIVTETVEVTPDEVARLQSRGPVESDPAAQVNLTDAEIIVSGGRGLQKPENFSLVRDLADALGGAVGASRAVVDAGWIPYPHQVGQTGRTVTPKLYVACGISGAIQHLAGMRNSDIIVAINKDPEAPIFKVATYGIVGDLFEVLPQLTEKLRAKLGEA